MAYKLTQLVGGGLKTGAYRKTRYLNSNYDHTHEYMQQVYVDSKNDTAVVVTTGIGMIKILHVMYQLFLRDGVPWHEVVIDGNHVAGKNRKPVVLIFIRTARPEMSHLHIRFKPIRLEY